MVIPKGNLDEFLLGYVDCVKCSIDHEHRKDRLFKSQRQWTKDAGLTPGTISQQLHSGNFTTEVLVALGRGINLRCIKSDKLDQRVNVFQLLVVAGKLEEQDLPKDLTLDEHELLRMFRLLPELQQDLVRSTASTLYRSMVDKESSSQEAVPTEKH